MSVTTMEQILAETRAFMNEKQASFGKRAKDEALDNPGSIPGSAHDKAVSADAGKADAEVQQGLPANSANNNAGATLAEKLEAGHTTDALTAHGGVTKKPMISADATAKEASGVKKHAQDLTSLINSYKEKSAAPTKPAVKKAEEMCEECGEGKADCTCEKVEKGDDKAASQTSEIELTKEVLAKIACTILSTEEGMNFTEKLLQKEAGAKAARDTIAFLEKQAEEQLKVAAYQQGAADAEALIHNYAAVKQANAYHQGQAAAEGAIKQAMAKHQAATKKAAAKKPAGINYAALGRQIAEDSIKRAQAEMMGMDPAAMGGAIDPAALGGLEGEDEAMSGMTGGGEEGGDISPEELEQVLTMMVQSGELGEEELAAILEQIGAAEGAESAGETVGALEEGAGEEAPEEDMEVQASAQDIQNSFLNHLARVRAGK